MSVAERKRREKKERKSGIIDAAEKLFYQKGFDRVTMDEIADEVELSKGSLYLYFKSKDSLFFAIVARKHREFLLTLKERLNAVSGGGDKLRVIINCYIEFAKTNPEYNEMATTYGPVIWSRIDNRDETSLLENSVQYNVLLNDAVKEGIDDGTIRNDLNPVIIGFYITLISMSVVSPLPAWKKGFELAGITFDEFLDNYSRFMDPSIGGCIKESKKNE